MPAGIDTRTGVTDVNDIKTKPKPSNRQFEFIIKREFNAPRGRVWKA